MASLSVSSCRWVVFPSTAVDLSLEETLHKFPSEVLFRIRELGITYCFFFSSDGYSFLRLYSIWKNPCHLNCYKLFLQRFPFLAQQNLEQRESSDPFFNLLFQLPDLNLECLAAMIKYAFAQRNLPSFLLRKIFLQAELEQGTKKAISWEVFSSLFSYFQAENVFTQRELACISLTTGKLYGFKKFKQFFEPIFYKFRERDLVEFARYSFLMRQKRVFLFLFQKLPPLAKRAFFELCKTNKKLPRFSVRGKMPFSEIVLVFISLAEELCENKQYEGLEFLLWYVANLGRYPNNLSGEIVQLKKESEDIFGQLIQKMKLFLRHADLDDLAIKKNLFRRALLKPGQGFVELVARDISWESLSKEQAFFILEKVPHVAFPYLEKIYKKLFNCPSRCFSILEKALKAEDKNTSFIYYLVRLLLDSFLETTGPFLERFIFFLAQNWDSLPTQTRNLVFLEMPKLKDRKLSREGFWRILRFMLGTFSYTLEGQRGSQEEKNTISRMLFAKEIFLLWRIGPLKREERVLEFFWVVECPIFNWEDIGFFFPDWESTFRRDSLEISLTLLKRALFTQDLQRREEILRKISCFLSPWQKQEFIFEALENFPITKELLQAFCSIFQVKFLQDPYQIFQDIFQKDLLPDLSKKTRQVQVSSVKILGSIQTVKIWSVFWHVKGGSWSSLTLFEKRRLLKKVDKQDRWHIFQIVDTWGSPAVFQEIFSLFEEAEKFSLEKKGMLRQFFPQTTSFLNLTFKSEVQQIKKNSDVQGLKRLLRREIKEEKAFFDNFLNEELFSGFLPIQVADIFYEGFCLAVQEARADLAGYFYEKFSKRKEELGVCFHRSFFLLFQDRLRKGSIESLQILCRLLNLSYLEKDRAKELGKEAFYTFDLERFSLIFLQGITENFLSSQDRWELLHLSIENLWKEGFELIIPYVIWENKTKGAYKCLIEKIIEKKDSFFLQKILQILQKHPDKLPDSLSDIERNWYLTLFTASLASLELFAILVNLLKQRPSIIQNGYPQYLARVIPGGYSFLEKFFELKQPSSTEREVFSVLVTFLPLYDSYQIRGRIRGIFKHFSLCEQSSETIEELLKLSLFDQLCNNEVFQTLLAHLDFTNNQIIARFLGWIALNVHKENALLIGLFFLELERKKTPQDFFYFLKQVLENLMEKDISLDKEQAVYRYLLQLLLFNLTSFSPPKKAFSNEEAVFLFQIVISLRDEKGFLAVYHMLKKSTPEEEKIMFDLRLTDIEAIWVRGVMATVNSKKKREVSPEIILTSPERTEKNHQNGKVLQPSKKHPKKRK